MEFTQGHEKYAEKCMAMALLISEQDATTRPYGLVWRSRGRD